MPPPRGVGLYVRDSDGTFRFAEELDFAVLHAGAAKNDARAAALRDAGKPFWIFSTPEHWTPARWREGLRACVASKERLRAAGIVADPENGWPEASNAQALALATELRSVAGGMDVGLTSFPLMPKRRVWGEACGDKVWGSPQLYDRAGRDLGALAAWDREWDAAGFGTRVISYAAWDRDGVSTPERFPRYLEALPRSRGGIGWPTAYPKPYMADAIKGWSPSGIPRLVDRAVMAAEQATGLDAIPLAAIGVGVACAGFAFYSWSRS